MFLVYQIFIAVFFNLVLSGGVCRAEPEGLINNNPMIKYINTGTLAKDNNNSVYDIGIDANDRIYIPNFRHNNIVVLDKDFHELSRIEGIPSPHGLTIDNEGFMYVATFKNGRVYKFDSSGKEVKGWDKALLAQKRIHLPVSLDVDDDNNILIADYGSHAVIKVNSRGDYIHSFDLNTITQKGKFSPHCVITDGKRNVYVADRGQAKTIQVFRLNGEYIGAWQDIDKEFDPLAVRFLTQELLLVPNYKDSKLHLFNVSGQHLAVFGSHGEKPGEFLYAMNLISDTHRHIYVVEEEGNRIQKIDFGKIIAEYGK